MFKLLYNRSECITDIRFRIRPSHSFCITDDIYTNPLTLKNLIAESKIFLIHDLAHFVYTRTQVKERAKGVIIPQIIYSRLPNHTLPPEFTVFLRIK